MTLPLREGGRAQTRVQAMVLIPRQGTQVQSLQSRCAYAVRGRSVPVCTPAVAESSRGAAARAGAAGRVRSRLAAFCRWFVCENAPAAWVLGFERALHAVVCVRACVRARFP